APPGARRGLCVRIRVYGHRPLALRDRPVPLGLRRRRAHAGLTTMAQEQAPALAGIRVVAFSHFVAGPFCTMLLGALGAEVTKIENAARGDDMRRIGPQAAPGQSAPFLWANRNKQ